MSSPHHVQARKSYGRDNNPRRRKGLKSKKSRARAPRRPKGLTDLPTEILEMICVKLADDGKGGTAHPRELLNFGRTFKRMHVIVRPMLYRTIVGGRVGGEGDGGLGQPECRRVRLADLIRSVWKNPDLGGLIRHLSLNLFGDEQKQPSNIRKRYYVYGSASWNKESLAQAVRRFLGRNMEKMPVPSSIPVWCQRSLIPVFLLLAMARNLEHLSLSVSRYWNLDGVMRTSQTPGQAIIPRVKLPNLQSLEMWLHEGYDINLSNNHMRAIVHLFLAVAPGLTTLQLRGFPRLLNLPPLSDLQHLVLVNTHLSQQSLFALTSAAPALKHLCTLFYGDHPLPAAARLEPDFDGANADLITSRLHLLSHSPLAATLRTVVFSDYMLSDIAVPSIPLFVNLNLTVLGVRYLDYDNGNCGSPVSLIVLLRGCPSLRGLLITGAFRMGSTGLRQFADAVAAGDFPSLRRVKLVARKSYWKKLAKIAKAPVPARFKAAGVEFEIGLHELEGTAGLVREMEEAVLG